MAHSRSHHARIAARRHSTGRRTARSRVLGAALLGTGIAWLAQTFGLIELSVGALLSVFLIVLGMGLVFAAKWGPFWNLVFIGLAVGVVLTSTASVGIEVSGGVGDAHVTPLSFDELQPYALAVGDMHVDLTRVSFPNRETEITGTVNVGHLLVIVPSDIALRVESHAGIGGVSIFGMERSRSGFPFDDIYLSPDFSSEQQRILMKLRVGIGQIEVRRGS